MSAAILPAAKRMARARSALLLTQPFWGVIALQLELVEVSKDEWVALFKGTNDNPTMAADGAKLYFHADFVASISDPEVQGVIAHETEHVARMHHTRRGKRDPRRWNIAADHAINLSLQAGGFRLPKDGFADRRFQGLAAEKIYAILDKEERAKKQEQQQQAAGAGQPSPGSPGHGQPGKPDPAGQPSQGQGAPSPNGQPSPGNWNGRSNEDMADEVARIRAQRGQPGNGHGNGTPSPGAGKGSFGEVLDAPVAPAEVAAEESRIQTMVRQAAMVAKARGAGVMPGAIAEIIGDLNAPKVDWRAVLRRFGEDSTQRETDWTRQNRRFIGAEFILPGSRKVAPAHVVNVFDTSGSMDRKAAKAVIGETQGMLDEGAVDRVTVVYCDTRVHHSATYEQGDVIPSDFHGRGGTAFQPAFNWIAQHCPEASAIVYLTDMQASDWPSVRDPAIPVLWACTARPRSAPFGEIIEIDPNA